MPRVVIVAACSHRTCQSSDYRARHPLPEPIGAAARLASSSLRPLKLLARFDTSEESVLRCEWGAGRWLGVMGELVVARDKLAIQTVYAGSQPNRLTGS